MNAMQDRPWPERLLLFRYFRQVKDEVNRYKWLESEREGHDIGWDRALVDWTINAAGKYFREHPPATDES